MIPCAKGSARRAALTVILCGLAVACVGEVNTGKPNGEDDADAALPPAGDGGADASRSSDANVDAGPRPANDTGAGDARPMGSDAGPAAPEASVADAGPNPGPSDAQAPDMGTPGGRTLPVFVAVGYKGLRMVSRDLGLTWQNMVTSGSAVADDEHLLRGVTYGKDLFVAVGWKIWTSPDAVNWTERSNPAGQWYGGVKFGNNLFVAAGGVGTSVYSSDGLSWMAGLDRQGQAARSVAFGNNNFVAAVDQNRWWQTSNGRDWTIHSDGHGSSAVVWCTDHFSDAADCSGPTGRNGGRTAFGAGVYVSVQGSKLERSTDGATWQTVQNPAQTDLTDVAFGYVAE